MRGQKSGSGQRVKMNVMATALPLKSASENAFPSWSTRTRGGRGVAGLPVVPRRGNRLDGRRARRPRDDDALETRALLADEELRLDRVAGPEVLEELRLGDRERHRHGVHVAGDRLVPDGDLPARAVDRHDDALEGIRLLETRGGLRRLALPAGGGGQSRRDGDDDESRPSQPAHHPSTYANMSGRHDRRVGLDDELRRLLAELAPGDLLVRDGAGVAAEARRRVADLAEVRPERDARRAAGPGGASARRRSGSRPRCRRRSGRSRRGSSARSRCTTRRGPSCTRCRSAPCGRSRISFSMQCAAKMLPSVESSQPGTNIGRFFSAAARSQESFGSIW